MADPSEKCGRCGQQTVFEAHPVDPVCPQCGWTRSAGLAFAPTATRAKRWRAIKMTGLVILAVPVTLTVTLNPQVRDHVIGTAVVYGVFIGIPCLAWMAWQWHRDQSRPSAEKYFASSSPAKRTSRDDGTDVSEGRSGAP